MKSLSPKTTKAQLISGSGWNRIEANTRLLKDETEALMKLARDSKLGWPAFVTNALRCYADVIKGKMVDDEPQTRAAGKNESNLVNRVPAKTSVESKIEPAVEDACLGLCVAELKALEQWRVARFNKDATIPGVAHFAMLFALANRKNFSDWLNAVANYCEAEDLAEFAYMRSLVVAQYSTKKLKIV